MNYDKKPPGIVEEKLVHTVEEQGVTTPSMTKARERREAGVKNEGGEASMSMQSMKESNKEAEIIEQR
jgi:hypothetical protein